ncbi:MAG: hypothetical protein ACQKBY_06775, partial [Verrucomicrobiales bacterium]
MKKYRFLLACSLSAALISPLSSEEKKEPTAEELQAERDRLIELVVELEGSFGETLQHYRQLKKDYHDLEGRADQMLAPEKVRELREELEVKARELAETRVRLAESAEERAGMARQMDLMRMDLGNLRRELQQEKSSLEAVGRKAGEVGDLEERLAQLTLALKQEPLGDGKKVAALQKELAELKAQREAGRQEVQRMMAALEGAREAREKAEGDAAMARREREKMQGEMAALREKLAKEEGALQALRGRMKDLEGLEKLEKQVGEMAKRGEIWAAEEKELRREITDLKAAKSAMSQKVTDLQTLNDKERNSREDAVRRITELEKEREAVDEKNELAQGQLRQELERLKKELATAEKAMSEMEATRARLAALEKKAALWEGKVTELEGKLAAVTSEKKNLESQLVALEEKYGKERAARAGLEKEMAAMREQRSALEKKIAALQKDLEVQESALATAEKQAGEAEKLTAEMKGKEEELKKLRGELGKLHIKSELANKQLISLKMRVAKIAPVT